MEGIINKITGTDCSICIQLATESIFKIKEFTDSILFLNEDQFFKGYCILEYKKHIEELFELSEFERNLYMKEVAHVAKSLQQAFRPDKINYELLGNKVPHLHWHIIPRFKGDPAWPEPVWSRPHLAVSLPTDQVVQVVSEIQKLI